MFTLCVKFLFLLLFRKLLLVKIILSFLVVLSLVKLFLCRIICKYFLNTSWKFRCKCFRIFVIFKVLSLLVSVFDLPNPGQSFTLRISLNLFISATNSIIMIFHIYFKQHYWFRQYCLSKKLVVVLLKFMWKMFISNDPITKITFINYSRNCKSTYWRVWKIKMHISIWICSFSY